MREIMTDNEIRTIPSDSGVEIVQRGSGTKRLQMYINHNDHEAKAGDVVLKAFECKIEQI